MRAVRDERPARHRLPGAARLRGPVGPPARLQGGHRQGDAGDVPRARLAACCWSARPPRRTRPATPTRSCATCRSWRCSRCRSSIRIAYEALSWGRHVNEYPQSWDIVAATPTAPNLGLCARFVPHPRQRARRSTRWPTIDPRKIFLVQLSDFLWQEMRSRRGPHRHRAPLPRVSGRRRAQRRAWSRSCASSTRWAIAATTASRSSTTTTSSCRCRWWPRARGAR